MTEHKTHSTSVKMSYDHFPFLKLCSAIGFLLIISSLTGLSSSKLAKNIVSETSNSLIDDISSSNIQESSYFHKVYYGNGLDHMNINLVNINQSGLLVNDEVGVFDGIYCVGSAIIDDQNMQDNNLSIPASSNDTIESSPNGYISGHKVTIKVYRGGMVYQVPFQTVNDSQDIFEKGGSMFALVDFGQSTGVPTSDGTLEFSIYPNPFDQVLQIQVTLSQSQRLQCEIFDTNGILVKTIFDSIAQDQINLTWDGKDNSNQAVPYGIYFCRLNQSVNRIFYRKLSNLN